MKQKSETKDGQASSFHVISEQIFNFYDFYFIANVVDLCSPCSKKKLDSLTDYIGKKTTSQEERESEGETKRRRVFLWEGGVVQGKEHFSSLCLLIFIWNQLVPNHEDNTKPSF